MNPNYSYESTYSLLIGHRIRNERIALGMTQAEFARLLGISPSYLGALERGTRPVSRSIMNRLHEKTHISYDYLLEGLETPKPPASRLQNIVAEPEHYRIRRDIGLLLVSCTPREAKDCYQLIHTYLEHLRSSTTTASSDEVP